MINSLSFWNYQMTLLIITVKHIKIWNLILVCFVWDRILFCNPGKPWTWTILLSQLPVVKYSSFTLWRYDFAKAPYDCLNKELNDQYVGKRCWWDFHTQKGLWEKKGREPSKYRKKWGERWKRRKSHVVKSQTYHFEMIQTGLQMEDDGSS